MLGWGGRRLAREWPGSWSVSTGRPAGSRSDVSRFARFWKGSLSAGQVICNPASSTALFDCFPMTHVAILEPVREDS